MSIVRTALRRPYTVLVLVLGIVAAALLAVRRMPADVFPPLGVPTIYVAQPYAGMDASQMEGFLTCLLHTFLFGFRPRRCPDNEGLDTTAQL